VFPIYRASLTAIWIAVFQMTLLPARADDTNKPKLPDAPLTRIHARANEPVRNLPDGREAHGGLLVRELVRQAILIAARDELGLPTRDSSLEDKIGSKDPNALEIQTTCDPKGKVSISIKLGEKWQSDWKYETEVNYSPIEGLVNYRELSEKLEQLSRTEIPKALESARFAKQQVPSRKPTAEVEADLQECVARLSSLSQLSAIRRIHRLLASDGESPELLEALSKSYAHLSMLSQRYLSNQCTAFSARSLLYAARLAAIYPDSSRGLWAQAYALGFLGCDLPALQTMQKGTEKCKQTKEKEPDWKGPMEAKCHYDPSRLDAWLRAGGKSTEVVEYLQFQSTGGGEWFRSLPSVTIARDFARHHHPGCTPITRLLAYSPVIMDQHAILPMADQFLRQEVAEQIGHWDEMPALVKRALQSDNPLQMLPKAMINVGLAIDKGEPSARSIGRLIIEMNILQIYDRIAFRALMLAAPWDDERKKSWPEINDHPLSPVIMFAAIYPGTNADYLRKNYSNIPLDEPRLAELILVRPLIGVKIGDRDIGDELLRKARWHADDTSTDLILEARLAEGEAQNDVGKKWLHVSPDRPAAQMLAVMPANNKTFDFSEEQIKNFESHPETISPLIHLLVNGSNDDATLRVLKKAISVYEEPYMYFSLASIYRRRNQMDDWRRTLDDLLAQPNHDLQHMQAEVDIANYLMEKNEFEEAEPYANSAAETYSGLGLLCQATCAEGMNDPDKAISVFNALGTRYPGFGGFTWYLACLRLDRGDRQIPRKLFEQKYESPGEREYVEVTESLALIAGIEGQVEESAKLWEKVYQKTHSAYDGVMAALTFAELKRADERDRLFEDVLKNSDVSQPGQLAERDVVRMIKDDLKDPMGEHLSREKIDQLLQMVDPSSKLNVLYFVGWHLHLSGKSRQGNELYKEVAEGFVRHKWVSSLAAYRLRQRDDQKQKTD